METNLTPKTDMLSVAYVLALAGLACTVLALAMPLFTSAAMVLRAIG